MRKRICLDLGHGGHDSGAIGNNGLLEKDVNLQIGLLLYDNLLKSDNYDIWLTRTSDEYVSLHDRAAISNNALADIFISIHCNSYVATTPYDIQVYYHKDSDNSERLANCIFNRLSLVDGGVSKWSKVLADEKYFVLRKTSCPACLIELEFISNPIGEKMLENPEYQEECAKQIMAGIDTYFGIKNDYRRKDILITEIR